MTATLCAFCEKNSNMTPRWSAPFQSPIRKVLGGLPAEMLQTAATCDNCGHASLALATSYAKTGADWDCLNNGV